MKKYNINKTGQHDILLANPGEYEINIKAAGAEVTIVSLQKIVDEKTQVKVIINHLAPHSLANTKLKGVVRGKGQLSLYGKIYIANNCPGVRSFLTERVLLLDKLAKAEAVPDLEILSDDVSCSHAATISPIDELQLFYLMSRGISRNQAEDFIVDGFLR